jgi:2-amino-4-ketopentanoate thiolase alpha subunit
MQRAEAGQWVQVFNVLLKPGERAPGLPEETAALPLTMKVKGFLVDSGAAEGETVTIRTVTGREVRGELIDVNPVYPVDYGEPQPELLRIGLSVRALLNREVKP